jgi:dienelactone hydrolase
MKLPVFFALTVLALAGTAEAKVITETVEYRQGDTVLEGYLAYDDATVGTRPGVLVIHEWTGLGDYVKMRVVQLAHLGYVAFAPDIYGKGIRPATAEAAAREAAKYRGADRSLLRARVRAGLDELRKRPMVDGGRLAAIGYCFGGTAALELARSGAELRGVVSFHGGLDTPNPGDAKNIRGAVLVLHGADDPHVPPPQVTAFQEEMRRARVDWQLVFYGGAVHGFTNPDAGNDPSKGVAYDKKADLRSWEAMRLFFAEIFGKQRKSSSEITAVTVMNYKHRTVRIPHHLGDSQRFSLDAALKPVSVHSNESLSVSPSGIYFSHDDDESDPLS